jgi:hypothetical protein
LQASGDLSSWTTLCVVTGTNMPSGPGYVSETGTAYLRQVLARDVVARETAPAARFIRLLLQLN